MSDALVIRADGGSRIGSGHIARCASIAREVQALGVEVRFAVADNAGLGVIHAMGFDGCVLGGDSLSLGSDDALALSDFAERVGATSILVDSYGVSNGFFEGLRVRQGMRVAYIDDMYTFADGFASDGCKWDVDVIVNYSFYASRDGYLDDGSAELLLGSRYAPVRRCFREASATVGDKVERALVTSGSTNPDHILERMVDACRLSLPDVRIDLVVGSTAKIDLGAVSEAGCSVYRNVSDLSSLMSTADIAISAAGTTLYELSCMGVPTVAAPIVENQIKNAQGFSSMGLGLACDGILPSSDDIGLLVSELACDFSLRSELSSRMCAIVDGYGAERIAKAIV